MPSLRSGWLRKAVRSSPSQGTRKGAAGCCHVPSFASTFRLSGCCLISLHCQCQNRGWLQENGDWARNRNWESQSRCQAQEWAQLQQNNKNSNSLHVHSPLRFLKHPKMCYLFDLHASLVRGHYYSHLNGRRHKGSGSLSVVESTTLVHLMREPLLGWERELGLNQNWFGMGTGGNKLFKKLVKAKSRLNYLLSTYWH